MRPSAVPTPQGEGTDARIKINMVVKKINKIMAARGKKKTNRKEPIKLFNNLANIHNLGAGIRTKGVEDMLVTLEELGEAVTAEELILGDC